MDIEKKNARSRNGRGEPGWSWSGATPTVGETSITPLGDKPMRGRLANLNPPLLNRYRVLVNELTQAERELEAAGYIDLAAAATTAREAVQVLYRATRAIENFEEREIERGGR